MFDWLLWFTRLDNSKIFALLLFFGTFCGIVVYVFGSRRRGRLLEAHKYIPLQDDDPAALRKVKDDERHED